MTRLRDLDTFTVVEPDAATSSEFGNAHNIVANEETDFIYVVGATSGPCFGKCDSFALCTEMNDISKLP